MSARTLVLLRHAKSDYPVGVPDHDRPLAARGRRDAPVAGDWIREHLRTPDLAVVSTAQRTRETWHLASSQLADEVPVRFDDAVYEASVNALLALVRALPAAATECVLVGHNPGTEDLAASLAGRGDPAALAAMHRKYPTSAIAVIEFDGSWADVVPGSGRLVDFVVPRG